MTLSPFNQAFASDLTPVFFKPMATSTLEHPSNSRELFHTLIHISEHYPALPYVYGYLTHHLQAIKAQYASEFSENYVPKRLDALLKTPAVNSQIKLPKTALNSFLVQYAPICFTELSWLATITQTVTNQAPLAIDLMAMCLRLSANGLSASNKRAIYCGHLLASDIDLPALHTKAFAQHSCIPDEIFDLAAIQLALAQFPRVFFPEILGVSWSHLNSATLPEMLLPDSNDGNLPNFLSQKTQQRKQEIPQLETIINAYLSEFSQQADSLWQRIQTGYWLHQHQLSLCSQAIFAQINTIFSPRQSLEHLLATLIPHAIGHHGNIRLGAKTIDEWFKETPFKSVNFLATLLHSPYVDRVKPENSKLLKLFDFNGSMFGVLDDNGTQIIKEWLLSELNPGLAHGKKNKSVSQKLGLRSIAAYPERKTTSFMAFNQKAESQVNFATLSNKDLYFYLVNSDLYPEVLSTAKIKVNQVLTLAKLFNRLPFKTYSHEAFEGFIKGIYQHETTTYKPLTKKPKLSKDAYIWGIEQFAPTILTDGSWLQTIYQLNNHPNYAIGALLQKIYQDETGNGILARNHPHIYHELLHSLNIDLPPVYSKDFTQHPGFIRSAFDIPLFLMAIAKFPSTYLPELLGLNMAIELSGLGKVYLRLSQELKFWGINPAIVDVHISIDNLASGHSALAITAIQYYLDEITATCGDSMMQAHWRRIYTGFCSLQTVSTRFKFSLIWQYLFKRAFANHNANKGSRNVLPF